jgi:hypothetical protein
MGLYKPASMFRKLTHTAGRALAKTADFVEKKALPTIEKVAGAVSKGISYATPLLGAAAPELLPVAFAAKALANRASKASMSGEKLVGSIRAVSSVVDNAPNVKQIMGVVRETSAPVNQLLKRVV